MWTAPTWRLDATLILTRSEFARVLADLQARTLLSLDARTNPVIFRVACCCGLRVSEIAQLRIDDVIMDGARPYLRIRAEIAKGNRPRRVPLWWDAGTLADLRAWKTHRLAQGSRGHEPLVASPRAHRLGQGLKRSAVRRRFLAACKSLGLERLRTLTIHHGRHTFISHALAGERTLAEVRIPPRSPERCEHRSTRHRESRKPPAHARETPG